MNVLRKSKFWVVLALLAVFGVVITPTMAFACCCAPNGQQAHVESCHNESDATARSGGAAQGGMAQSAVVANANQHHAYPAAQCNIDQRCECHGPETLPFASEAQNTSAFSLLALATPTFPFALAVLPPANHFCVGSDIQRPPKPCFISLPSRAPPAI